jgi:hypothetical protein
MRRPARWLPLILLSVLLFVILSRKSRFTHGEAAAHDQTAESWQYFVSADDNSTEKRIKWCQQHDSPGAMFLRDLYQETWSQRRVFCPKVSSVGGTGDGKKLVCVDHIQPGCLVYSFGSNLNFNFERDMVSRYGCSVFTFDCTVGIPDTSNIPHGIKFYPWCISGKDQKRSITSEQGHAGEVHQFYKLDTIMSRLDHAHLDFLKLDIERHEYDVFESLRTQRHSTPTQLVFEAHLQNSYSMWGRPASYSAWQKLWKTVDDLGYGVFGVDPNMHTACCAEFALLKVKHLPS